MIQCSNCSGIFSSGCDRLFMIKLRKNFNRPRKMCWMIDCCYLICVVCGWMFFLEDSCYRQQRVQTANLKSKEQKYGCTDIA